MRARWAAVGAAVAVSLGAGAVMVASAAPSPPVASANFVAIDPCRLNDTRGIGEDLDDPGIVDFQWDATLTAGGEAILDFAPSVKKGFCSSLPVSGTMRAVVLNVTVTQGTAASFLSIYPNGYDRPLVSSLNWTAGETIPNAVTVVVGTENKVRFYNHAGTVEFIVDIVGYYAGVPA